MSKFDIGCFPVTQTISLVSKMLESTIKVNDTCNTKALTCFYSDPIPSSGIEEYLLRIHKYAPFSNECLLNALIYLDRGVKYSKETDIPIVVNSHNVHRLLVTAIMIVSKYSSDVYFTNTHYAHLAQIHPRDLNVLEMELLFLGQFDLMVHPLDLQQFGDHLLRVQSPTHRANTVPSCAPGHVRKITAPPKFETSLKSGKTSVSVYVNDLAEIMQNTDISGRKGDRQSIANLKRNLTSQVSKTESAALLPPTTIDNSFMQLLFNPQSQISPERRDKFLVLLNRCRKKFANERNQPMVKRLIR
ncbi:cyclin-domain-containing protein [Basidiobolus meristosporus CBS 931.73]|uniref:Cyclin-domain-containing protein n=1 Tax=Basidiobolus meristosporus CBS 931.73 TaxID=1314790 RepID=A0A1Y1Y1A6_9FUNG|nr:cyclin-domain-containing protein [Basidiobolus meristosporus CBS 931.73]|eukprot:ORX91787.1 cyclin-domain-containing protein [Basidiobolus meristosporus CBS 931.73]